jgi:hypothetical protein
MTQPKSVPVTRTNAPALPPTRTLKLLKKIAALFAFLIVLVGPFRAGWTQTQTDFPNYYTAAVAVRHHLPLRDYYDWTWFARQMNYAGLGNQIGAYSPQTPLTMLPMLALTAFPVQRAKQIWLACNLFFLALSVWLLSLVTRFTFVEVWLLAFCGYFSLRTNFLYGQYYLFLLFLLTLAFYSLHRNNASLGGALIGITFALKLYGGPFLLYFAARREWKALLSMIVVTVLLASAAIALFGASDVRYYATQILPRTLEGGAINPYTPLLPTLTNFLRHLLVGEPEMNPRPLWEAPGLFFFLRTFLSLAVAALLVWHTSKGRNTDRHDFAWFMIGALVLSSTTSSYTYILLLLPLVLLLEEATIRETTFCVLTYVLLTLPLHPRWLFPKLWLLLALFVVVGWRHLRTMPWRATVAVAAMLAAVSLVDARFHMRHYADEPRQHFRPMVVQQGAIFSSFPAVSRAGLFYQSMGPDRYVLRWLHDNKNELLSFPDHALHPRVAPDGESIDFELVANSSTMMRFDPATRTTTPLPTPVPPDTTGPVVSPDGKWIAYESVLDGPVQIWVRNISSGTARRLTGGNCNNSAPAWDLDSKSILFASDCDRALGLPALYRAPVDPQ